MAKKKAAKNKKARRKRPATISAQVVEVKKPLGPKKKKKATTKKKAKPRPKKTELVPMDHAAATLIPKRKQSSLIEWCNLYLGIEGRAGSDNTFKAKRRDLESFLGFLQRSAGTDHPDQWTRSVTRDFLKYLERKEDKSPSTIKAQWYRRRDEPPSGSVRRCRFVAHVAQFHLRGQRRLLGVQTR